MYNIYLTKDCSLKCFSLTFLHLHFQLDNYVIYIYYLEQKFHIGRDRTELYKNLID